jgi:hypothetical protein
MAGFVSDAFAAINFAIGLGGKIATQLGNVQRKMAEVEQKIQTKLQKTRTIRNEMKRKVDHIFSMKKIFYLISSVLLIGKCFFQFGDLVINIFKWSFSFTGWFFSRYIPWFLQFVSCTFQKIMHLPKCFMWYGLETAGWIFYLPFRFLFWLLDEILFSGVSTITDAEHTFWKYLVELDNTIHDGLGTGIHIVHFPDSVIETCYTCKIDAYPPGPQFPYNQIQKFIKCVLTPF